MFSEGRARHVSLEALQPGDKGRLLCWLPLSRALHRAGGIMGCCEFRLRLLGLIALITLNTTPGKAALMKQDVLVQNFTGQLLQAIPENNDTASVETLLLSGNNISLDEGDRKLLAMYPNLVDLQLGGNQVTHIAAKFFSVTRHLVALSLTGNQLSSLDPESFFGLDALKEVDLSHNQLTSLPPQLFSGLKNLQVVNLQGNLWNCSCLLLSSIREITAAGVDIVGPNTTCATAEGPGRDLSEAVAECYPSTTTTSAKSIPQGAKTTVPPKSQLPTTPAEPTPTPDRSRASEEQTPALGNSWKFTACVAVLAVVTAMLIVGAIKGPSWYKLLHNYRHRRLSNRPDEDRDEDVVTTGFSETGGQMNQRTFVFETDAQVVQAAEAEDEYFEDPYIKREE